MLTSIDRFPSLYNGCSIQRGLRYGRETDSVAEQSSSGGSDTDSNTTLASVKKTLDDKAEKNRKGKTKRVRPVPGIN